ncbi:T7SS effector LXG polymorphic toxin [Bacillus sonorensis]|uniref:Transposase n=2 Tax=Bacillus sonorensis TaxID=119858 RepID=M5P088_9BACI|nr:MULTISPECIES: T7SS effector LXG polymorphic toxin [Bacillus]TWK73819.1 Ribonuclease YqcG [Bacillus paralicheniformis]ASB91129.1 Ribonuclease YobL [Bacillus sonorensis]EME72828.1 transposase [Bacillus sonorensis L12]MBG9917506.1 transposase [Bacillus sonorensis]MCF7619918.1 ribonuclease YeeF family protein [Bacillus sonorensis]
MKVYEANSLLAAMKERLEEYKRFREDLVSLKKAFQGIADLDDDFQGRGADNIKAFYKDQAGIVDDWLNLADMQIQFLNGVSGMMADANLSGDTFVDMEFLENQLAHAYLNSKTMVSEQKKELKSILEEINDLISLETFSAAEFKHYLDAANKVLTDTIQAVNDLDHLLKREYEASEIAQQLAAADYSALISATGRGKSAAPIRYNAKAYQGSEAYQLKQNIHKRVEVYIKLKKDQAEARKMANIHKEQASQTIV